MNRQLIYSNFSINLYRIFDSKKFDFELETSLENGDCLSLKISDNARLTKMLAQGGVCTDRLQALDFINHCFVS